MSLKTPIENNIDAITGQIKQARVLLDSGKDFDLTPILEMLEQVQSVAGEMAAEERAYFAQSLNDIGVSLTEMEDKINRNNNELTNLINTLDSA